MLNFNGLIAWIRGRSFKQQLFLGALIACFSVFLCDRFFVEAIYVSSSSMDPTVKAGERLLLSKRLKWPFFSGSIHRFDVVVIDSTRIGHRIIKRVVGVPGDCVTLLDGYRVLINGQPLVLNPAESEQYFMESDPNPSPDPVIAHKIRRFREPKFWFDTLYGGPPGLCLKSDEYFVLGDHRWRSKDSRSSGPVSRSEIQGKAFLIWLSVDRESGKMRWERVGQSVR